MTGQDWRMHAACRGEDPDLFFPSDSEVRRAGQAVRVAKLVCRRCPVTAPCLAEALSFDAHGVWGGTSRNQRTRMIAKRRAKEEGRRAPCGTPNGYRDHRAREENACDPCTDAWMAYRLQQMRAASSPRKKRAAA